ncbi:MAG TPA: ABC transporter ATP-binding protein [Desulfobulbus sp.]|nr:ABC transporter ATP-binding protein [Desulfobulbus sp.]
MSGEVLAEGVGKKYKRYPSRWARLVEWLSSGRKIRHQEHWVLRNITFQVQAGEAVGIIGRNGAGKSTLLKLLTRTTLPSTGRVETKGSLSALLELGMGSHMDFSGRVNAKMTCQMMGLSTEETHELLPKIAEFSELGDYFDQPMRVYSTGMQVRLAFSAATAIRPEILIVDEALSVGDAYFQHKCIERIRSFRRQGTTLLFVSHDPGAVKSLCERAILIDEGEIRKDGSAESVLDYYNAWIAQRSSDEEIRQVEGEAGISTRSGTGQVRIDSVEMVDDSGRTARAFSVGDEAAIHCRILLNHPMEDPTIGILIRDRMGNDVFGINSYHLGAGGMSCVEGDCIEAVFSLSLNLGQGNYSLSVAVHPGDSHLIENCDWWDQCLVFQVIPGSGASFVGVASLPVAVQLQKVETA